MQKYDTLYHKDNKSKIRVWWMEREGNKYRTVAGIENGQLVTSEWKEVFGKNIGKANATTNEEQADQEVKALYTKKLDHKYHTDKGYTDLKSKIIEPMLAATFKGWGNWNQVYTQPKLDGMRCIATRDGLFSRAGKRIVSCPHIEKALENYFRMYPKDELDGELYNHELRDDFNELMSILRQTKLTDEDFAKSKDIAQYHIYDIVDPAMKFSNRFKVVSDAVELIDNSSVKKVETYWINSPEVLDINYDEILQNGYEGQMIRLDTYYENKRTNNLLKRKEFIDEEFEVLRLLEGKGNWAGYAKSIECITEEGIVFNAGVKGSQKFAKELLNRNIKYATVRYQNRTPDGSLRFPIAVDFFENKREH
ncbi:DNA ligase [uncultured Caudovirales phage]|uniref:DNA ligase n=1 Tax=uncultured Caudovirales phage TaxID=2100421 RepID=A0A6J5NSY3_9CAUD|nr:DNA ligase [uncultured Caudovirales phage]